MTKRTLFVASLALMLGWLAVSVAQAQRRKPARSPRTAEQTPPPFRSRFGDPARAADSLLARMTLQEKIGQLNLLTSDLDQTGASLRPEYRLDIEAGRVGAIFNAYGVAYVRKLQEMAVRTSRHGIPLLFGYDVIHGHRTIFPMPLGMTASWDPARVEAVQRIAALEAASMGLDWTFTPMVDISRDPRWGRVMEGSGEDPYLASVMARAQVRGLQGRGIGDPLSVMACVKHFAAYGAAQAGRDYHTVDMSERTLRETYLPPFRAAIEAGCATVMTSFNEVDGVPATASRHLLTDILRKEWGFGGFVVTDYTAIMEMILHGYSVDSAEAAAQALLAGNDMDMQSSIYIKFLPELVRQGKVPETAINAAARRVLIKKFELGLFDDPYRRLSPDRERANILTPAHRQAAREMAARSCVLLENNRGALPLRPGLKQLALIGPLGDAAHDMIGAWSAAGQQEQTISLLTGMRNHPNLKGTRIVFEKAIGIDAPDTGGAGVARAIAAAREADVIFLALGESKEQSGEAASRSDIRLPGAQPALVSALRAAYPSKPIVMVLFNGRPLDLSAQVGQVDAILEAWYPGTEAGPAVADVLTGAYNPSGKLPMTFPRSVGQVPIFYNHKNTGRPIKETEKYTSKYLDVPNTPLFAFGHGLSYTRWGLSAPTLSARQISMNDSLTVEVTLTNEGDRAGEQVVQLYVRDLVGSVTRPVQELKGFRKVSLPPGGRQTVRFTLLPGRDLSFFRQDMTYGPEPGDFEVMTGLSSDQVQRARFTLN